jgi:hypothetical protein
LASVFLARLLYNVTYSVTEHIFYQHLLQKHNPDFLLRQVHEQIWPSIFLFACLSLLAILKIVSFSKVFRIVQSIFNSQVLQQLEREEYSSLKFYSIVLNVFFVLNVSFLAYKINALYKFVLIDTSSFGQFSFFFLIILLVFSFKTLINKILTVFTDKRKVIVEYDTSSTIINQSFGLFLFPITVLIEFSPFNPLVFISGALIVLGASIVLKWYRGFIMGLIEERIGLLQIFSYFCALEILPVFVLVKYVIETF